MSSSIFSPNRTASRLGGRRSKHVVHPLDEDGDTFAQPGRSSRANTSLFSYSPGSSPSPSPPPTASLGGKGLQPTSLFSPSSSPATTAPAYGADSVDDSWQQYFRNLVPNAELLSSLLSASDLIDRRLFQDQPVKLEQFLRLNRASGDYVDVAEAAAATSAAAAAAAAASRSAYRGDISFGATSGGSSLLGVDAAGRAESEFILKKVVAMPEALREQQQDARRARFYGLFPEISRAWMSIDNKFFMWNYADASDFCYYDELDEFNVIIAAAVVPARPGVFRDEIKHLLVLATPVLVVILAIDWRGPPVTGELSLLALHMSVYSDNVNMLGIVGTSNGRIFMCGNDGCFYELLYQAEDGWFTKRCRKINHSTSTLGSLIPTFLKFRTPVPLIQTVVDDVRGIAYTLSEQSAITVFDLGSNLTDFRHVHTASAIHADAAGLCQREPSFWDQRAFSIGALHIVHEAGPVHLIAVTTTGIRLYFTTFDGLRTAEVQNVAFLNDRRPNGLVLAHVRLPPRAVASSSSSSSFSASTTAGDSGSTALDVSNSYCAHGVCLLATNDDRVLGLSHTTSHLLQQPAGGAARGGSNGSARLASPAGGQRKRRLDKFLETQSSFELAGPIHAVSEIPLPQSLSNTRALWHSQTPYNELATQHALPPRRLLCLTDDALAVYIKLRPIDELYQLLSVSQSLSENDALLGFFAKYGAVEARTLCLSLACAAQQSPFDTAQDSGSDYIGDSSFQAATTGSGALLSSSSGPMHPYGGGGGSSSLMAARPRALLQSQSTSVWSPGIVPLPIRTAAGRAFFCTGPSSADGGAAYGSAAHTGNGDLGLGFAVARPEIFSDKHAALCLYLSRLLRPIWNERIFERTNATGSQTAPVVQTRFAADGLRYCTASLAALLQFLAEHREFTSPPNLMRKRPHPQADRPLAVPARREIEWGAPGSGTQVPSSSSSSLDEADLAEKKSLWSLHVLAVRCKEALEFLLVLTTMHSFNDILAINERPDFFDALTGTSFQVFATADDGVQLTKELISLLVLYYTNTNRRVEDISDILHRQCPSFFGQQDRERFVAYELLNSARKNAAQRQQLLDESLRSFEKIAGYINLSEIAARYMELLYFPGVVTLALACARAADPHGLAAAAAATMTTTDSGDGADERSREAYRARLNCYQVILYAFSTLLFASGSAASPLGQLDPPQLEQLKFTTLGTAMLSQDRLFHSVLYEWFLANNLSRELLLIQSDYLESFLLDTAPAHPDRYDLLWRYYFDHGRLSAAAKVLLSMAELPVSDRPLSQRISDLNSGIVVLKSSPTTGLSSVTTAATTSGFLPASSSSSRNRSSFYDDNDDDNDNDDDDDDDADSRYNGGRRSSAAAAARAQRPRTRAFGAPSNRPVEVPFADAELLQELEEKLEVAQIQEQILTELQNNRVEQLRRLIDSLEAAAGRGAVLSPETIIHSARLFRLSELGEQLLNRTPSFSIVPESLVSRELQQQLVQMLHRMTTAVVQLNERLVGVSELYENYARPFRLWEICLAIFESTSHNDAELVKAFWHLILNEECELNNSSISLQRDAIESRVVRIGRQHSPSLLAFPVPDLCELLEKFSFQCDSEPPEPGHPPADSASWVLDMMRKVPIPYPDLFDVYLQMFAKIAPGRRAAGAQLDSAAFKLHLARVMLLLLRNWIAFLKTASPHERRFFEMKHITDAVNGFMSFLQTNPTAQARDALKGFRDIHQVLSAAGIVD